MTGKKPLILFGTEGSYPYSGGGVSTWSHILCSELADDVDFHIMAITGHPNVEKKYRVPVNVQNIIHIPLWGVDEPSAYYDVDRPFSYQVEKKGRTSRKIIKTIFLPIFRDFVRFLFNPYENPRHISEVIYGFWKFFQAYDYKISMREPMLWLEFKGEILRKHSELDDLNIENPRVFDTTFGMRWLYHFLMPLAAHISGKVDVTHSTLAGFPALSNIAAKYEYGTPGIVTDHGVFMRERLINIGRDDMPFFSKKLLVNLSTMITRAVYYSSDQISPVTQANKKWELRFEATEDKIRTIYNGVDTNIFKPTPKPAETADIPTVIAVAQVFPLKDIETMIRTADLVRKEIPEVKFIVYGSLDVDKEYVNSCRELIEDLGLEGTFEFGGFHNQPSKIFNEGDISILTSISEGFPYTVIESMSCARPVVATDVGGIRDALEGCGILCKPRDPQDIANGVIKLLTDDTLRIELGQKAREKVLLSFTTEKSVDEYRDSYLTLAESERNILKDNVEVESVIDLLTHLEQMNYPEYAD